MQIKISVVFAAKSYEGAMTARDMRSSVKIRRQRSGSRGTALTQTGVLASIARHNSAVGPIVVSMRTKRCALKREVLARSIHIICGRVTLNKPVNRWLMILTILLSTESLWNVSALLLSIVTSKSLDHLCIFTLFDLCTSVCFSIN